MQCFNVLISKQWVSYQVGYHLEKKWTIKLFSVGGYGDKDPPKLVPDKQSCIFRAIYLQKWKICKLFDARFGVTL